MGQTKFRLMKISDLDEVMDIEENSFTHAWSRDFFEVELKSNDTLCLIATVDDKIAAYLVYTQSEIINLAVVKNLRRLGIAEKICKTLIDNVKKLNLTKKIWLNVRPSNIAAIKLYEKLGFKIVATNTLYYYDEDSFVMRLDL